MVSLPAPTEEKTATSKRKRPSPSIKPKGAEVPSPKSKAKTDVTASIAAQSTQQRATTAIFRTLILDNGGDSVKYGWLGTGDDDDDVVSPKYMPNVTARLPQQWTVLTGDEIHRSVTNPNSCIAVTRSTERGIITNLGNQIQVWKRLLDVAGVVIQPLKSSEAATTFGWNTSHKSKVPRSAAEGNVESKILSHQCAVLIGIPPYTPRSVLDQLFVIWLGDFGFARAGFCVSSVVAAIDRHIPLVKNADDATPLSTTVASSTERKAEVVPIACVVDLGWSAIHIVPVYQGRVIPATNQSGTIRRLPLGARHLIQIWKYYCSYRQWNLMDSEWILHDVFEKTAFVSLHFHKDMLLAGEIPAGRRPYDREYVLPNYTSTFTGTVQISEAVKRQLDKQKLMAAGEDDDDDYDEDNDEDYDEKDMEDEVDDDDDVDNEGAVMEDQDSSEDEESPEEIRKQLLKQREEERRRLEIEAEQHQILNVSVERFSIPEALFRPSDVGLPPEWANLPQAIVQAIEACPAVYRAGLYRSIQLTGGLSQLMDLKERLEQELRALAPYQYPLNISSSTFPLDQAWKGVYKLAADVPYTKWSVSREEWESASMRGAWKRLLMSNGGYLV